MNGESLERKIARIGSPVQMLRNAPQGAYEFPMPAEYSNWRDEQRAWRTTAVLFNQSFHMTDIYFKGPDVARLFSDLGVNSFATFGKNKAKQFVAVNADGRVIGDAILFGLADDEFSLVGRPSAPNWAAYQAKPAATTSRSPGTSAASRTRGAGARSGTSCRDRTRLR